MNFLLLIGCIIIAIAKVGYGVILYFSHEQLLFVLSAFLIFSLVIVFARQTRKKVQNQELEEAFRMVELVSSMPFGLLLLLLLLIDPMKSALYAFFLLITSRTIWLWIINRPREAGGGRASKVNKLPSSQRPN